MTALPKFQDEDLLKLALTHRSVLNENKKITASNERLEFLGDAIISFLTSDYLYNNFPKLHEGSLTNLRSLLVRTETLASISLTLDLGSKVLLSKGEEDSGGRKNTAILANTFEAFVGALFLDQGIAPVSKLLEGELFPKAKVFTKTHSLKDHKSLFQEIVQEKKLPSPVYKIVKSVGPEHAKIFTTGVFVKDTLWGTGTGKSKQEAEQNAAKVAIEKFQKS